MGKSFGVCVVKETDDEYSMLAIPVFRMGDMTACEVLISKSMAKENISNALRLTMPVFCCGDFFLLGTTAIIRTFVSNIKKFLVIHSTKFMGDLCTVRSRLSECPDLGGGDPDFLPEAEAQCSSSHFSIGRFPP